MDVPPMIFRLKRLMLTDGYTAGALFIENDFLCWTLEDKVIQLGAKCEGKIHGKTAIPKGKYEIIINYSNRFQKMLPLLLNVPCFEGIRIHSGNTPTDTEGCILVGMEKSASGTVFKSRAAFDLVMNKIKQYNKKEKVFLEVE